MAYQKKKEFNFDTHPITSLLFIDIETVAKVQELEENTPLYDSFVYKMRYTEEAQRKDFNSYNVKALFAEKAALYPEFGKVVCITVGKIVDGVYTSHSFNHKDEKTLLTRFHKALAGWSQADPNLALCGINLKFFDLRFIYIRSVINKVRPIKNHIDLGGLKPWEVYTADLTDIWKQTSPYNAPLACIAESLGIESPKQDIDGSQVSKVYYTEGDAGLERITKYCELDVLTTAKVAYRLKFEEFPETKSVPKLGKVKQPTVEIKDIPFLQRLYNMNTFDNRLEDELKEIISKKKLTQKDKKHLREILLGVYLRTDFINGDKDSKDAAEQKTIEIDNFIKEL